MISLLGISLILSLSFSLKIFPVILLTINHIFLIMLFVRIWSKVRQFSLVYIFLSSHQLSSRQCGDIARTIHLLIPLGSEWRVKAALNTLLWVLVGHTWSRFVWKGSEKKMENCANLSPNLTRLWWRLQLRVSKRPSPLLTTVPLRASLTSTIRVHNQVLLPCSTH